MDRLPFEIVSQILSNLTTTQKFLVMDVCIMWKNVIEDQFYHQQKLGIRDYNLRLSRYCLAADPHHVLTDSDIVVIYSDNFPFHILKYFKSLVTFRMRINCEVDAEEAVARITSCNGHQLQCMSCLCNLSHNKPMEKMRHLLTGNISTQTSESLVCNSPDLTVISCRKMGSVTFSRLPAGLQILQLESEHANMQSIFKSPAAQTLTSLSFRVRPGISSSSAHFKLNNLTSLQIRGSADADFVPALLLSLRYSHSLKQLDLYSMIHTGIENSEWMQLFPYLPQLQSIKLSFQPVNDDVIEILVACCPRLTELTLTDSRLTDKSLDFLSQLQQLQEIGLESWRNDFTDEAVIRLLRGPSRSMITNLVVISKNSVKSDELMHEINTMKEEEGNCLRSTYFHSQY
jgi:hypothetical protein